MKNKLAAILAGQSLLAFASATQAEPADSEPGEKAELVGEVVVTARRRAETLQDVPQTVNVVTDKALQDYAILDFADVSQLVPGLTLEGGTTGYTSNASVRGVRFSIEAQAGGPTTEFYVNEAPMEASSVFQTQYDIGQIEVLKGPQGTIRGRSAPSGAFTLTTRPADPAGGWSGYVATTFDDHDGMNLQAAANIPIVDDVLAVRVAGETDENDANGIRSITAKSDPSQDTDSYRVSLAFTPGDALRARLMYQELHRDQETFGMLVVGPGASPANSNQPALTLDQNRSVRDNPSTNSQRIKMATANLDYSFAGQVVSYVGGWNEFVLEDDTEGDANNYIVGPALPLGNRPNNKSISHELRLASEQRLFKGFLDYTIGAFYQNVKGVTNVPSSASYWPGVFGPAGAPNPTVYNDDYHRITRVISARDNEEKSYFAGVDLHLAKGLDLSLGARHVISQRDQRITARQEGEGPGGAQRVNLGVVANCSGTASGSSLFGPAAGATLGTGTREPSPFYPGTCDVVFSTPFALNLSPPVKDELKMSGTPRSLTRSTTTSWSMRRLARRSGTGRDS
jgi:iron complex outermembrane receptor protein